MIDLATFFSQVRPHMPGKKLKGDQVAGMEAIITGADVPLSWTAYALATTFHETGARMTPVREGFALTDEGARRAVAKLFSDQRISVNYALPNANGVSFYGRGIIQITHEGNYRVVGEALGLDLVNDPDLLLTLSVSVKALWFGMIGGVFRKGNSLESKLPSTVKPTLAQWTSARGIINGDVKKIGPRVAAYADFFYDALKEAEVTGDDFSPEETTPRAATVTVAVPMGPPCKVAVRKIVDHKGDTKWLLAQLLRSLMPWRQ